MLSLTELNSMHRYTMLSVTWVWESYRILANGKAMLSYYGGYKLKILDCVAPSYTDIHSSLGVWVHYDRTITVVLDPETLTDFASTQ